MQKILFLTLLSLGFFSGMQAALPPFYESVAELRTILTDQRLAEHLGSAEFIMNIQKNETGYLLTTTHYTLQVDVVFLKTDVIGPAKFELKFHDPIPMNQ